MRPSTFGKALGLLGISALLGACGDSGSGPAQSGSASSRGVIASASDCVSFGADTVNACATAIEQAVARHETGAATYSNLQLCEAAIGESKCERAASGRYRQRLSAFLVTVSGAAARAEPLYPAADGKVGFQTANKTVLLTSDHSIVFSSLAISVAETQAAEGGKGRRKKS